MTEKVVWYLKILKKNLKTRLPSFLIYSVSSLPCFLPTFLSSFLPSLFLPFTITWLHNYTSEWTQQNRHYYTIRIQNDNLTRKNEAQMKKKMNKWTKYDYLAWIDNILKIWWMNMKEIERNEQMKKWTNEHRMTHE